MTEIQIQYADNWLKDAFERYSHGVHSFSDSLNGEYYKNPEFVQDILLLDGWIVQVNNGYKVSPDKLDILSKHKYSEYLDLQSSVINDELSRKEEKESVELELAKSNIKANKLNASNSKFNKWFTIANIIIGIINIVLVIMQLS